ncbi:16S rRNA (guanine(527)-N(7))-methyltransferase RsmG [Pararhodobacter oceanensis]|uniref:16S rRNA (guanine(527)-N(7))-methyltransferase RsmG n=1 Tax=Pararhodobacter oceanensis TaxID=2172121 RepID=UPI003A8E6034
MQQRNDLEACVGANVSRETLDALVDYSENLIKWSGKINLIAPSTMTELWTRHICDSAQVLRLAPDGPAQWADLGSGGGLPGIVVAILLKDASPGARTQLIESDKRKAAFLKLMIERHALNANVVVERIEKAPSAKADIVTARALAPLDLLLTYVAQHMQPMGTALLFKGRNFQAELDQASLAWQFNVEVETSRVDPESRVLRLSRLRKREIAG